ncbi:MAG TPA: hypothetical protein VEX64_09795, partial [Pyrinomonadaceae bacterium]|nr:hypothetical protein [Pyrinomonadaceae bacterium]
MKKTKEQILNAYENRLLLTIISGMIQVGGIALTIILSDDSTNYSISSIVLFFTLIISGVLIVFAIRCPICNSLKSPEYFKTGFLRTQTFFFRCNRCNLSNKQIKEYVD